MTVFHKAFGLLLGLTLSLVATHSAAQDTPCKSPRSAIKQFTVHIDRKTAKKREPALRCFDWESAGSLPQSRARTAQMLKGLLDAQGIAIELDDFPDHSEADEEAHLPIDSRVSEVWLEHTHGEWRIAAASIQAIAPLYEETFTIDVQSRVERLPAWMQRDTFIGMPWWQLLAILILLATGFLLRRLFTGFLARHLERFIENRGEHADLTVVVHATKPLGTLLVAGFFWYCLPLLHLKVHAAHIGGVAVRVLSAGAGVWLLYRLVDLGSNIFAERAKRTETKLDDQIVPLVRKALKVVVLALGTIFVLQNLDVDVGSLIAGASLGGLAFSLAAKDTVANFFGSISILADHPFQVDDWVIIDSHEGTVEEVGMRSTRIRTVHDSLVTIPNSIVANSAIDNRGARRFRRCLLTLGVTYDTTPDMIQAFTSGIEEILERRDLVRTRNCLVKLNNLGDSAIEILLLCFFEVDTWAEELEERQELLMDIIRLADSLGVGFAFPTQTVHIESMPKS